MKNRLPYDTGEPGPNCPPHHWIIDSHNIGRCIKPGCTLVRNFEKLQERIVTHAKIYYQPREQLPEEEI
jgi:hypothetical protein